MPFGFPDKLSISPWDVAPTKAPWPTVAVAVSDPEEANKKLFAAHINNGLEPFKAACAIFPDTRKALWASANWPNDPIVKAAIAEIGDQPEKLLDKNELAVKLLHFAEEKNFEGTRYVVDAKDRLAAYKLYAEVRGFIGKIDINPILNNTNNFMTVKLVRPDPPKDEKIIEQVIEHEPVKPIPFKIKAVG